MVFMHEAFFSIFNMIPSNCMIIVSERGQLWSDSQRKCDTWNECTGSHQFDLQRQSSIVRLPPKEHQGMMVTSC